MFTNSFTGNSSKFYLKRLRKTKSVNPSELDRLTIVFNLKLPFDPADAVLRRTSVAAGPVPRVLGLKLARFEALHDVAVQKPLEFDLRLRITAGLTVESQLSVQQDRNHIGQLLRPSWLDW